MKKLFEKRFKYKVKKLTGILLLSPPVLRDENIDYLLITDEGVEYHLIGSKKTFRMKHLIDTKVQVTGFVKSSKQAHPKVSVITFKCVDDFLDTEGLPINEYEEFDTNYFDYAI